MRRVENVAFELGKREGIDIVDLILLFFLICSIPPPRSHFPSHQRTALAMQQAKTFVQKLGPLTNPGAEDVPSPVIPMFED